MKNIYKFIILSIAAAAVLSACVKDLDTVPLNETDFTSEKAYADPENYLNGLAYIESYMTHVSQDKIDESDISKGDAGASEFIRQYTNLNEMSADTYKCSWGDSEVNGIQYDTWTAADNASIFSVYTRSMKGVTLVNEFLLQTEDDKIAARGHQDYAGKIAQYRAEAKFVRAFFYYVLMDLYGNPPFATPDCIGGENPKQLEGGRAELAEWIEEELTALLKDDSAMPAKGEVAYPRPTKGSAQGLLAKLYLNWEVYTGTARWADAQAAAKKTIEMGYTLHGKLSDGTFKESAYAELFMQDNGMNCGDDEFIFCADYDKDYCQSWGGTTHLISGFMNESGLSLIAKYAGYQRKNPDAVIGFPGEKWSGYHTSDAYVSYFDLEGVEWGGSGMGYDRSKSDRRAFFFNEGQDENFVASNHESGWICWKFNGVYSDSTTTTADISTKLSSSDFPIIRLADIYLIYAEATYRATGALDDDAYGYIKDLRSRAGVSAPLRSDVDLDWILEERARELMLEGHRRTDLIRYGYFTSMSFPWPYKGGIADGAVSLESYRTIYPIPTSDLNANPNLVQNPGY